VSDQNSDSDLDKVSHDYLKNEVLKLRVAIRNHRDQRGDDRCWMDDVALYKNLPEGVANADLSLLSDEQFRRNCDLFIKNRKCPVPQGAVIGKYIMDRLRQYIGKSVTVISSHIDLFSTKTNPVNTGTLTQLTDFDCLTLGVSIGATHCYFVNEYSAIRKIFNAEWEIIYENRVIPVDYGKSTKVFQETEVLRVLSFGKETADQLKKTSSK